MDPERVRVIASAVASSDDLVLIVRADGLVAYTNRRASARWATATSARASALFPEEHRAGFEDAARAALESTTSSRFEWGTSTPDAVREWFSCTVSPIEDGERVVGLLVTAHDVTELKRSALRLRRSEQLMVDTQGVAHLGTWEWDVSEPTATWSAELYKIYGLTPETYTPSYDVYLTKVHPDDRQRVIDATNRAFHEHEPYSHDERVFRPDGSIRHLHTWAFPVLDDGGKLVRLVGVCQDITDRKLAEEAVMELNADLERRVEERTASIERSLRDLEAFQAMLSHDLRAPLSIISGSAMLLLEAERARLPEASVKHIERIERAGAQMTRLVEDLLTLAHVNNRALERVPIDLGAMCTDVIGQLRQSAPERIVDVSIQQGLACSGDPALVRTMLENLLGNAWKYTAREAAPRIEVGSVMIDERRTFFVRDNGAGFDMKEIERLFIPFERLHAASEFPGNGVGLAAVHRIVERHDGRIWAVSAPSEGTTFYFRLGDAAPRRPGRSADRDYAPPSRS